MINWLEKHILSLDKGCKITNASSTDSTYYAFGDFKIRVSNHLSANNGSFNVSIVQSLNAKLYTVTLKSGNSTLIFNYKELKSFLTNVYLEHKLKLFNTEMKEKANNILKNNINSNEWSVFTTCLDMKKSKYQNLSKHQKTILRFIFNTHNIKGKNFIEYLSKVNTDMNADEIKKVFNVL